MPKAQRVGKSFSKDAKHLSEWELGYSRGEFSRGKTWRDFSKPQNNHRGEAACGGSSLIPQITNSRKPTGSWVGSQISSSTGKLFGELEFTPSIPRKSCMAWTPHGSLWNLCSAADPRSSPWPGWNIRPHSCFQDLVDFFALGLLFQHPLMSNLFLPIPPAPELIHG